VFIKTIYKGIRLRFPYYYFICMFEEEDKTIKLNRMLKPFKCLALLLCIIKESKYWSKITWRL